MIPDVVVDVGNSRIKWGRCSGGRVAEVAVLAPDDTTSWQEQRRLWDLSGPCAWALSGVHPLQRDKLATWLRQRNEAVLVLETASQLPLRALIDQPDRVGIDRLLNAVGARCRVPEGTPLILVDAGSAVTVDWVDETGAFRGGAIFPGLRLMAQALRDHTALLPLVEVGKKSPPVPGTSTAAAIEAGVFWAAVGGINSLIEQLRSKSARVPVVFFAGGDAALLATAFDAGIQLWPTMTLEGIRVAAEAIP